MTRSMQASLTAIGRQLHDGYLPTLAQPLPSDLKTVAGGACVLDGVMYFSCGHTWGKGPGSTQAPFAFLGCVAYLKN